MKSAKAATNAPFSTTGSERPKKSGIRGAGLTRIALSVFWKRSPPIACAMANRQGIEAYWSAFPIRKNSSEARPAERPM